MAAHRRASFRKPKETILIVCEGKKTEPNYFKSLRQYLRLEVVQVEVIGEGGAPITVVGNAIKMRDKRRKESKTSLLETPFDEIWCVFDTEDLSKNRSYHEAVEKAEKEKIKLALSNPCIELWFLLHFKDGRKPFANYSKLEPDLKTCIHNYQKNMAVFELIYANTNIAFSNAQNLIEKHPNLNDEIRKKSLHQRVKHLNPSTTIHLLVKKLQEMSDVRLLDI